MVTFTNVAFNGITGGEPFTITWTDATGPVTIKLNNKASPDVTGADTIAKNQTGNSYTWNVPSSLAGIYNLEISDTTETPNYSPSFEISSEVATATSQATSALPAISTAPLVLTITQSSSNGVPGSTKIVTLSIPSSVPAPGVVPNLSSLTSTIFESTATINGNPVSTTQSDASTTPTTNTHQTSLSSGAKAGIGVGVTLGVVLIFGIAALFFWFGKRVAGRGPKKEGGVGGNGPSEVEGRPISPRELQGSNMQGEGLERTDAPMDPTQESGHFGARYGDVGAAEVDTR